MPNCFCASAREVSAGEVEPVGIHVRDHDVPRSGVANYGDGHDADRACTGDQHVFAEHGERKRGVDCVAKWVEDCGDFLIDAGMMTPDIGHGQRDVFGESSGAIDAYALRVGAEVAAAGHAVAAASADDVALAADDVAGEEVVDVGADLNDFADKFVADGHGDFDGFLRPVVPLKNMHIRAADACISHSNQHIVNTNRRLGNILEPKSFCCLALHQCLHEPPPSHRRAWSASGWPTFHFKDIGSGSSNK